ncbi:MAG: hypothetical protein V3T72_20435, partial [Thermoanaerobaculia bacterium]
MSTSVSFFRNQAADSGKTLALRLSTRAGTVEMELYSRTPLDAATASGLKDGDLVTEQEVADFLARIRRGLKQAGGGWIVEVTVSTL